MEKPALGGQNVRFPAAGYIAITAVRDGLRGMVQGSAVPQTFKRAEGYYPPHEHHIYSEPV